MSRTACEGLVDLTEDGDLCRVTVEGPQRRVDMALPVDVPFADLLPVILSYSGRDLAEAGLEHDGWILQRLDETAIDAGMTPAQVSLTHGDVLYLRPATRQLPEFSVGDADAPQDADPGPAKWLSALAVSVTGGVSAAAVAVLLLGGFPWVAVTAVAGALGLVLLGLGAVAARWPSTSGIGLACRFGALPLAFLSGLHTTGRHTAGLHTTGLHTTGLHTTGLAHLDLLHVLTGLAALAPTALACSLVADGLVPVFSGVAGVALAGTAATGLGLIVPELSVAAAVALVTTGVLTVQRSVQWIVRRVRARTPHVPMRLEEAPPEPQGTWSYRAMGVLAGLTLSTGVTGALTAGILAFSGGGPGWAVCAVLPSILLLRARDADGDVARHVLVLSGTTGLALLLIGLARTSAALAAVVLAVLFAGAAALVAGCLRMSRRPRRPSPDVVRQPSSWSRTLGAAEGVLMLAGVVLALAMAGLFAGHVGR
ncbi:EsaB/YukD family protein [Actinoallomurus acaciae]|uniref:EsaB/YukD family protein n=1 Tax=Actinoallomurus acaciae TaxID=502577 RepID=A0ABV5YNM3_9ACTN